MAVTTVENLEFHVKNSGEDGAVSSFKKMGNALKSLAGIAKSFDISHITKALDSVGKAAETANKQVSELVKHLETLSAKHKINLGKTISFDSSGGGLRDRDAESLMNMSKFEELDRRLGILMDKAEKAAAMGNDLQAMNLAQQANKIKAELEALENIADETSNRFDGLRDSIKKFADSNLVKGFRHLESAIKRIFLYRMIRSAVKEITNGFKEGLNNAYAFSQAVGGSLAASMDRLTGAAQTMKNQLGAAFGGLIQAAEPVLLKVVDLVTTAANALSQLIAALSGKNVYKKATAQIGQYANNVTNSFGDAADAVQEYKNQLMGFDEINRLEDSAGSSNGGSGSYGNPGSGLSDIVDSYDYAEISDFWKKVADIFADLKQKVDDFGSSLKLSIKDVFFDWKGLNAEQIAEKLVVGLCGILGGIAGFIIGGPLGALVGTITGVAMGLMIDSLIFDHDGVLSRQELGGLLTGALFGLAGGAIGFVVGGPAGALIGATVGIGLFAGLKAIEFLTDGKIGNLVDQLAVALTALAGGLIGFTVGGPAGAVIGAVIGIGLAAAIQALKFDITDPEFNKYKNGLDWFVCGVLHMPTNEQWKQWGKDVISWIGEGFSGLTEELEHIFVDPIRNLWESLFPASKENGVGVIEGFFKGLEERWHVDEPLIVTVFKGLINKVKSIFKIGSPSKVFEEIGKELVAGFLNGIQAAWNEVALFFENSFNSFLTLVNTTWRNIKSSTMNTWNEIKSNLIGIWNGLSSAASSTWSQIKESANSAWTSISTGATNAWTAISNAATTAWNGIVNTISTAGSKVQTVVSSMVSTIKSAVSSIKTGLNDAVSAAGSAKTALSNALTGLASQAKSIASTVSTAVSNAAKSAYNTLSNSVSTMVTKATNSITTAATRVTNTLSTAVNRNLSNAYSTGSIYLTGFASGGFPEDGLFYANHNELVGQFSNGKTAVANNDQIVEGISEGVYQAVAAALSSGNIGSDTPVNIYMDGKLIAQSTTKYQKQFARAAG